MPPFSSERIAVSLFSDPSRFLVLALMAFLPCLA